MLAQDQEASPRRGRGSGGEKRGVGPKPATALEEREPVTRKSSQPPEG